MEVRKVLQRLLAMSSAVALIASNTSTGVADLKSVTKSVAEFVPGEVLVKFKAVTPAKRSAQNMGSPSLNTLAQKFGVQDIHPLFEDASTRSFDLDHLYKVILPQNADVEAAADSLAKDVDVEYAEPNYVLHTSAIQPDLVVPAPDEPSGLKCDAPAYFGVLHCKDTDDQADIVLVDLSNPYVRVQTVVPLQNPKKPASEDNLECNSVNPTHGITGSVVDASSNCAYPYPAETISSFLRGYIKAGAVAAINTDYFGFTGTQGIADHGAQGLAVKKGVRLDGLAHSVTITASHAYSYPSLAFYPSGYAMIGIPASDEEIEANLSGKYFNTVAGAPIIIHSGQPTNTTCPGTYPGAGGCNSERPKPQSQSAAGLNSDGTQLTLITAHKNAADTANYLLSLPSLMPSLSSRLTVSTALKFDGGGSARIAWLDQAGEIQEFGGTDEDRAVAESLVIFSQKIPTSVSVNDPLFKYQYALNNTGEGEGKADADIDAPEAWGVTTGTTQLMLAVIDSGVYYTHTDLNDGRIRTDIDYDYVNNDDDASDDNGHGTHVTGIIAAETNNGFGTAGVMWQAKILPLKVCDAKGSCNSDNIAKAIRYAADKGARIINMSLGGSCSSVIADAINYAHFDKGVVIVAAAGNDGSSVNYPAAHDPVIAVGATDKNDKIAHFSSRGPLLDLVAPGVGIWSTVPKHGHDALSGTSMASPHVAGVAGLLLSQRPDLSNEQVRDILRQSADDLGPAGNDPTYGYGRVNAFNALMLVTPIKSVAGERATCPACAAIAAANTASDGSGPGLLSTVRAVRDKVFVSNPGRRWASIYYEHQLEVAGIVLRDGEFRSTVLASWQEFNPIFQALLDKDAASSVQLTQAHVEAARRVMMGVAERGSSVVHSVITDEWARAKPDRLIGMTVQDAWQLLQRENAPSVRVYLPIIVH